MLQINHLASNPATLPDTASYHPTRHSLGVEDAPLTLRLRTVETRKQERALRQHDVGNNSIDQEVLRKPDSRASVAHDLTAPQMRPRQTSTRAAPPPYRDEKSQEYEYQAPPPQYEKA
ncbi:hypothetical protein MMC13_003549 [Lambiella insularis]|nr:hypothetical protein [Lambiella insularis]